MSRLLKVDFYKMFRSKSFYIVGIVLVAMTALLVVVVASSTLYMYNQMLENAAMFGAEAGSQEALSELAGSSNIFSVVSSTFGSSLSYASIFAILFLCSEFSHGTIKNIASKGFRRESIYFSKYICSITCVTIYSVLVTIVNFVCSAFVIGDKIPGYFDFNSPNQFFISITLTTMLTFSYMALVIMIASVTRSTGPSIAVFFILSTLAPILIPKLDDFLRDVVHTDFVVSKYTLSSCMSQVSGANLTAAFESNDLTRFICVAVGFFVVFTGIGVYLFRKRDM